MCGRFTRNYTWAELHALLNLSFDMPLEPLTPRFNLAPTQHSVVIRRVTDVLSPALMQWGLVPSWSDDDAIGSKLINARSETAHEKPSFRAAFKARRCIVPISGFYEWQATDTRTKQPWYIQRADHAPMLLAGLWESAQRLAGPLETFTILTTAANAFMARYHDRMPAILEPEHAHAWLASPPDEARSLLVPASDGVLAAHSVSTRVNSPRNDDPSLIDPIEPQGSLFSHTPN